MGSRKKKRLREQAAREADPFSLPEVPLAVDPVAEALAPLETPTSAGPFCVSCGSEQVHESPRRGARERWLGLGGSRVFRCESCGSRLAVAGLVAGGREAREARFEQTARRDVWRQRRATLWLTSIVALLTFLTVAWLIYRAEQGRLDPGGVQAVP